MVEDKARIGVDLGMGWLPDYPDFRDYGADKKKYDKVRLEPLGQTESVHDMLKRVGMAAPPKALPTSISWVDMCSPIENQGPLGSCTAQAGVGLVEYYERRAFRRHIDGSRLFLYKATRNLLGLTGDTGAFLRTTMAAMVLFGVPPEKNWCYDIDRFDEEPSAFCYSFADNYKALQYFRLDPPGTEKKDLLRAIKTFLAAGLPSMFGFTVFSSIREVGEDGKIPYPGEEERILGGHAVMVVGFDDGVKIENPTSKGVKTKGALQIRNSWGTGWGDKGYGWLPYDYVTNGLAVDWWTLLKSAWVDTKNFGF